MSTGYSTAATSRVRPRAESYLQSLIPWPITPEGPQDPVDIRIAGGATVEVPINFNAVGTYRQTALRFMVKNEYAGPALTGVLTWTGAAIGSFAYAGVGTRFLSELRVGDYAWFVGDDNEVYEVYVSKVVSDTQFLSTSPVRAAATAQDFGVMLGRNIPTDWSTGQEDDWTAGTVQNTGTVTLTAGANTLAGVGTLFLTELVVGDRIEVTANSGVKMYVLVDTITNDTTATIKGFAPLTATAKSYTRFYTRFSDIAYQLGDSSGRSFGQEIIVQAQQGAFGSMDLYKAIDGIMHQPYFLGRREALVLRIRNRAPDARRVHAHVYTVRVLT